MLHYNISIWDDCKYIRQDIVELSVVVAGKNIFAVLWRFIIILVFWRTVKVKDKILSSKSWGGASR